MVPEVEKMRKRLKFHSPYCLRPSSFVSVCFETGDTIVADERRMNDTRRKVKSVAA
jgi:hypothetical protein